MISDVYRVVNLDLEGFLDHDWMLVVVQGSTGVHYRHQHDGHACRPGSVEGYLVPVFSRDGLVRLRRMFEEAFRGAGTWNYRWTLDQRRELAAAVSLVGMPPSGAGDIAGESAARQLDVARLSAVDEAWVPVVTPDGPGLLPWPNSD
jgi:hypothetical protein